MEININVNSDCEEYNRQYKEGVLKSNILGDKKFKVVEGTFFDKFWIGNRYYDCTLHENGNMISVQVI